MVCTREVRVETDDKKKDRLKQFETIKYLGSMISDNGGCYIHLKLQAAILDAAILDAAILYFSTIINHGNCIDYIALLSPTSSNITVLD